MGFFCNPTYTQNFGFVLAALVIWTIPWKALALWRSARHSQKWWFIIFILVNTIGLLEIFYLLVLPRLSKEKKEKIF